MVIQLSFDPYEVDYEEKTANAISLLKQHNITKYITTSEAIGRLTFYQVLEELGWTEEQGLEHLEAFYNVLGDNQSKHLLKYRIFHYFNPNLNNLKEFLRFSSPRCLDFLQRTNELNSYHVSEQTNFSVLCYGAGKHGKNINEKFLNSAPHLVSKSKIFVDKNYESLSKLLGNTVISPQDYFNNYSNCPVIITSPIYTREIEEELLNQGITQELIYRDTEYRDEIEIYFDPELIKLEENEVFVDVGVLNAHTSLQFVKNCQGWSKGNSSIFLFEPNEKSYSLSEKVLQETGITNFEMFPVGLWDEKTVLYFEGRGGNFTVSHKESTVQIPVDTLDHILGEKRITFLKMDIEGSELKALKGAKNTIQKHKPKLAISLYHKPSDLFDIPSFLRDIVPEYKFYLRHYSCSWSETVLYAII